MSSASSSSWSSSSWPIGKTVPEFDGMAIVEGDFKKIKLSDYRGKYLVFLFYRRDFTYLCPAELIAFEERMKDFTSIECQLIACSTDSRFSHFAWVHQPREKGGLGELSFPLLADPNHKIARTFGVLNEEYGFSYGSTFIIDGKGVLRQLSINDHQVGRNIDEIIRLVQAFQYVDKNGEVCPANWRPGSSAIKPVFKSPKSKSGKKPAPPKVGGGSKSEETKTE